LNFCFEFAENPKALKIVMQTLELSGAFRPPELAFIQVLLKKKNPAAVSGCDPSGFAKFIDE
jgi:hypothetical protein